MKRHRRRKCRHCRELFLPDPRNLRHQHCCSKPACRRASKAASQQRWLRKAENHDYFRGPANVQRVRAWRGAHPGYRQRASPQTAVVLQEDSFADKQVTPDRQLYRRCDRKARLRSQDRVNQGQVGADRPPNRRIQRARGGPKCELFLVINGLEEFAAAVNDRLSTIDFTTKREIVRALVKRIEIHKDEIVVVFRVDPDPGLQSGNGSANSKGGRSIMQDRTRRSHPSGLQDSLCTLHLCCSRWLQSPYHWQRCPPEAQHSIRVGG
jgi:hypothetical protein